MKTTLRQTNKVTLSPSPLPSPLEGEDLGEGRFIINYNAFILVFMFAAAACGIEPQITSKLIEFRRNENKVIFKNNVNIKYGNNLLCSDTAVKDEKNKIVELSGNVKGYYFFNGTTDTIKVTAQNGLWDLNKREVELTGRPWVLYTSTSGQGIEIESDRVILDDKNDTVRFYDKIILHHKSGVARSELAEYEKKDGKITLFAKGDILPVFDYSGGVKAVFVAEKIALLPEEDKLNLEKRVDIKIHSD